MASRKKRSIHSVPCPQEDRLVRIEEDMGEQGKCLIRIEEQLKVVPKIDERLGKMIEGNDNPGIPTRVSVLEESQKALREGMRRNSRLLWAIVLLTFGGLVTGFISVWTKAS